jgi:hypothetical protein
MPYFLFEEKLHGPLVYSPHVLNSERHFYVAKIAERCDERGSGFVCLDERYLEIA